MARDYTYQELMAMQEEATQRVREMQRRAQLTAQRAQEELDRKQSASPPISAPQEKPAQAKATEHSTHREPQHLPMGLPPTAGKTEDDADRLSFLDNKPQHPQPPTGKPHSPKHISLPVDYIQDKKEMPSPIKEGRHTHPMLLCRMVPHRARGFLCRWAWQRAAPISPFCWP